MAIETIKISQLNSLLNLNDDAVVPIVQDGETYKSTLSKLTDKLIQNHETEYDHSKLTQSTSGYTILDNSLVNANTDATDVLIPTGLSYLQTINGINEGWPSDNIFVITNKIQNSGTDAIQVIGSKKDGIISVRNWTETVPTIFTSNPDDSLNLSNWQIDPTVTYETTAEGDIYLQFNDHAGIVTNQKLDIFSDFEFEINIGSIPNPGSHVNPNWFGLGISPSSLFTGISYNPYYNKWTVYQGGETIITSTINWDARDGFDLNIKHIRSERKLIFTVKNNGTSYASTWYDSRIDSYRSTYENNTGIYLYANSPMQVDRIKWIDGSIGGISSIKEWGPLRQIDRQLKLTDLSDIPTPVDGKVLKRKNDGSGYEWIDVVEQEEITYIDGGTF